MLASTFAQLCKLVFTEFGVISINFYINSINDM